MSESEYWELVRELVDAGHATERPKQQIAEQIVHQVTAAADADEQWAGTVLMRWSLSGATVDYTRVFKDMNYTTYIRRDGRKVRKTVAFSRPKRSVESGAIVGRQMQAWWGMSRAAVAELRRETFEQYEERGDAVAALDMILAAMDRHPECATALEAWEADGRSASEINLDETGT